MWLIIYELWMFIVATIFSNNGIQFYTRANMEEDSHVKWLLVGFVAGAHELPIQFAAQAHYRIFGTQ
jgi:hypothetical protein